MEMPTGFPALSSLKPAWRRLHKPRLFFFFFAMAFLHLRNMGYKQNLFIMFQLSFGCYIKKGDVIVSKHYVSDPHYLNKIF
uniref:Uncharacterized protein n=1 Tax=Lepeophtheirus salmonis TaxID=72036 RepID=A0A0K2UXH9_LEPSM